MACVLAWFVPTGIASIGILPESDVFPLQAVALLLALAWGGYTLWQGIKGNDAKLNRVQKHYDSK